MGNEEKKMKNQNQILFNKGVNFFKEKNFLESEKCFEKLNNLDPNHAGILNNLSFCYFENKKFEKSEKIIRKIIDLSSEKKNHIEFLLLVLKKQDKIREINEVIFKYKTQISPRYELLEKFQCSSIPMNKEEIDECRLKTTKNIEKEIFENKLKLKVDDDFIDPPLFPFSYHNKNNLELSLKINKLLNSCYPELQEKFEINKTVNKKIKIGFISEFFKNHTIANLYKGLIINLDDSKFEKYIFNLQGSNGLDQEFIEAGKKNKLKVIELPNKFKEKINLILKQNLDIIFYPDIGMSTHLYYLTFLRLAKFQVTSWGHPETTGNPNIDYFLSSKLLEIELNKAQEHYSEKLILSDYLPMYYSKPLIKKINDYELIQNNIYSCPQTLFKIHPDFDEIIKKILINDKKAKIFFINDIDNIFSKKIFERLSKKLNSNIENVKFINQLSKEEFINHCGRASVLLDPLYFGAGNSLYESLVYGTPTVSLPTEFLKGKTVEGAYKQMKIEKPLLATDIDEYVYMATEAANLSSKKILEKKKYYQDQAEKHLFKNNFGLISLQNLLINIMQKS